MNKELLKIKEECENSLWAYAQWMCPDRYWGDVHEDFFNYFQYGDSLCKLALIPRDHQKSFAIAVAATWLVAKMPWVRINYVSYSSDLVEAQMNTIQDLFYSEQFRELWPDHLNFEKDKRKDTYVHKKTGKWNTGVYEIDHPDRKKRMVRDPTIRATTVKSGNTGMHCDYTIFDDVVTDENYNSPAGKKECIACYKSFAKIMSAGGEWWAVGTKYADDDLYAHMAEIQFQNNDGELVDRWTEFRRSVEDSYKMTGDGNFLWPRMVMPNGAVYGFDKQELSIKKNDAQMGDGDLGLFGGQYYNDPSAMSEDVIAQGNFKYLDPRLLEQQGKDWYYNDKKLKLSCGADLAWTDSSSLNAKRRDYTALALVGIDEDGFIYVLALERFQTDKPEIYYKKIQELHEYWGFNKITIETNSAGKFVKSAVESLIRVAGGRLEVEGKTHTSHDGKKEERIAQVLHSRYRNGTIYHTKSGYTKILEQEIKQANPATDDLKDAVAIAVSLAVAPFKRRAQKKKKGNVLQMSRFQSGGQRRGRRA